MEKLYFKATIAYVIIIMFIPITTIFISNSLIILQIYKARKHRQRLFKVDRHKRQIRFDRNSSLNENTDETTNFNNYDKSVKFIWTDIDDDCEHKHFHFQAINKNKAKIKISPLILFEENIE
jgi:hypothetical protein